MHKNTPQQAHTYTHTHIFIYIYTFMSINTYTNVNINIDECDTESTTHIHTHIYIYMYHPGNISMTHKHTCRNHDPATTKQSDDNLQRIATLISLTMMMVGVPLDKMAFRPTARRPTSNVV